LTVIPNRAENLGSAVYRCVSPGFRLSWLYEKLMCRAEPGTVSNPRQEAHTIPLTDLKTCPTHHDLPSIVHSAVYRPRHRPSPRSQQAFRKLCPTVILRPLDRAGQTTP